jgi:non-ribosomal peptide synthetase component F
MTLLFLDTEWADVEGAELVSLALVSEDGAHDFYVERRELPAKPTDFVRQVVYPLLDRGRFALSDLALTTAVRAFIGQFHEPCVLADYPNDLKLLRCVLAGWHLPRGQLQGGPAPDTVMTRMSTDGLTWMLVEDWFEAHPEHHARRHHALVDATALRMASLVATGRLPPPSWAKSALAMGRS